MKWKGRWVCMKFSETELHHLVFLSEVVLENKKRAMMGEMMQCLLYVVKSLQEADLSDDVTEEIRMLISSIENKLKQENARMQEIHHNLSHPSQRKPLG